MTVVHHQAGDGIDEFIPVRKDDIIEALIESGALASEAEREEFRFLCRRLEAIYHYEYFGLLERLHRGYYYFGPDVAPHAAMDRETVERGYADLLQSLDQVLKDASFVELPHDHIADAHRRRALLRVEVKASLDDFREVRFYRRGRHVEQVEIREWYGLRRRKIEVEVYDDVVLIVAMKSTAELASKRQLRALERRNIRPGSVLLKYFRNVASSDLKALFPNVRVVMSNLDKLVLGVPALIGGIPILLNIYATISVLYLVVGYYLGHAAAIHDKDMKTALAALSGLAALGAFVARQWVRYQRQALLYRTELADNIYYRNVNNNAGIFDYLVGSAEEQECKEVWLAYHFLHVAPSPPTADELDGRIEAWLRETFGVDLDFKVDDALARLAALGLLKRDGERLFVSPLAGAAAQLHAAWNRLFPAENPATPL
ncbi:MAG TPA: DUF3754 domain-containing protein [Xanthobacteraceae bacterium]|nr:DUF3754 domain-containing protein [Xanthobacteraceae bacterium]